MLRAAGLVCLVAYASGDAVQLTAKNFEKKVYGNSNRAAFVKFQAPWSAQHSNKMRCGLCSGLTPSLRPCLVCVQVRPL